MHALHASTQENINEKLIKIKHQFPQKQLTLMYM
jgi:hypothetical protein